MRELKVGLKLWLIHITMVCSFSLSDLLYMEPIFSPQGFKIADNIPMSYIFPSSLMELSNIFIHQLLNKFLSFL